MKETFYYRRDYFTLYSTTYFLHSENEGCLYNTLNGDIIALDKKQKDLLVFSESGNRIKRLNETELKFYDDLQNRMLGCYGNRFVSIEPTFWGDNYLFNKISGDKRNFEILQIGLETDCNYNCVFCDKDLNQVFRKTGCKRWKSNVNTKKLEVLEWNKYIREAFQLGCNKIQIFGGEPFLQWKLLKKIVCICNNVGIKELEIYTNGSFLTESILTFLSKSKVRLIIQISNLEKNKEILGTKKDINYRKILNKLNEFNIMFEILFIVSKYNEKYIKNYIQEMKKYNFQYRLDFIYPFPINEHYSTKYKDYLLDYKRKLIRVNPLSIGDLMLKNTCYSKIICISNEGVVYPCIMSRFVNYGVLDGKNALTDILNDKYEELRNLNKSKINFCRNCVYRLGCVNCSAIEIAASRNLYGCKNCTLIQRKEENG